MTVRPSFPAPLARGVLRLSITGYADGFAVRDEDTGDVLGGYDTPELASAGRQAGHDALAMLAACLASAPSGSGV